MRAYMLCAWCAWIENDSLLYLVRICGFDISWMENFQFCVCDDHDRLYVRSATHTHTHKLSIRIGRGDRGRTPHFWSEILCICETFGNGTPYGRSSAFVRIRGIENCHQIKFSWSHNRNSTENEVEAWTAGRLPPPYTRRTDDDVKSNQIN